MTILKRTGLVLLALITLLALWIAVNSIDDAELSPLAKEMLKPFPEVPPEENGYNDVSYLGERDGFEKNINIDTEIVRQLYNGKIQADSDTGRMLLAICKCSKLQVDLKKSVEKSRFKTPSMKSINDEMISYQGFVAAWRLMIIESRVAARNRDINKALDLLDITLQSTEQMQAEESHYQISYLIAFYGKLIALLWIHELSTEFHLNKAQYKRLSSMIGRMKDFNNDGSKEVHTHELKFVSAVLNEDFQRTITERLKFRDEHIARWERAQELSSEKIERINFNLYETARAIFPHYYTHRNKTLNMQAKTYLHAQENSDSFCSNILIEKTSDYIYSPNYKYPTYLDIITSNSYGNLISEASEYWSNYYDRRCLYHSYLSAIKIITAIHWYQSEHHKLPDTLDDLVPNYLNTIPLDYFDGKPMRYSKENRWVYSVGADYKDNGGSKDGFYRGGCHGAFGKNTDAEKDACRMNPTVPINWNDYPIEMR